MANALRNRDLKVRVGALEDQSYPPDHFDAVVSSHVTEHVHDPVSLLRECRRVLRPGGLLVVVTSNGKSIGSGRFGTDWRVLEPPRHITVILPKDTLADSRALPLGAEDHRRWNPRRVDRSSAESCARSGETKRTLSYHYVVSKAL